MKIIEKVNNIKFTTKYSLNNKVEKDLRRKLHRTIEKITNDIEGNFQFNTAVSSLMELLNDFNNYINSVNEKEWNIFLLKEFADNFVLMLSPIAPHICEELWNLLGKQSLICEAFWPAVDKKALEVEEVTIAVQINGKLRSQVTINLDLSEEEIKKVILEDEKIKKYIQNKTIRNIIYVPGKIINIVVQ